MTRHGVSKSYRETGDAADQVASEKLLLTVPAERREDVRLRMGKLRERRWWQGADWPRPRPGEVPRNVAIVGFGTTRNLAPFGEPGWELWCLNDPRDGEGWPARHAFTRWFQLHPPRYLRKHYPPGIDDLAHHWGKKTGIRLYMDRHYPEYPDSEAYPHDAVEGLAGHGWFHASSFDWMFALAILEGFDQIDLYGCDFFAYPLTNREPISALHCLAYWVGVAEGRGIKVNVHGGGHLFKIIHFAAYESQLQYGWDREPAWDLSTDVDPAWRDMR